MVPCKEESIFLSQDSDLLTRMQAIKVDVDFIHVPIADDALGFGDPFHDDWHHWLPDSPCVESIGCRPC